MISIFIVRGESSGAPESNIYGVYPTAKLALARIAVLEDPDGEYGHDVAWFDVVKVGSAGADCDCGNR